MKKISLLLSIMMIVILTGCGVKKDVVSAVTCTKQYEGFYETSKFTATNDKLEKVEISYVYDNSLFEVDTLADLTDDQKEQIKSNMLDTLGLESATYEGFEVVIDVQEEMTVNLKVDLTKVSEEVLNKVGLDFSETNMSFKTGVEELKSDGYTCK